MLSLSLSLGRWNLNFELGRAEEPEEAPLRVALNDNSELAEAYEPDIEDGFGFAPVGARHLHSFFGSGEAKACRQCGKPYSAYRYPEDCRQGKRK